MKVSVLTFGATREILKTDSLQWSIEEGETVDQFKSKIEQKYPKLVALNSLFIAVNEEYAKGAQELNDGDEIALIPPVSGG